MRVPKRLARAWSLLAPPPLPPAAAAPRTSRRLLAAAADASRHAPLKRTEEGVLIQESSPYVSSSHLVWGSVLWDSGLALAKFFAWNEAQLALGAAASVRSKAILELGAGTGVVGLTLRRLGAGPVTLTDCEPEVLELLRRNVRANGLECEDVIVQELSWAEPATFLPASAFDLVVAADVLYSRKDRWFVRALEAHVARRSGATALVACPPRADSPLAGFFEMLLGLGFRVERLEDAEGQPVGSPSGSPAGVYAGSRFAALPEERCPVAAADGPRKLQIFRITRT